MRILWASTAPHIPSGYGSQTALALPRLRALGHDVTAMALAGVDGPGFAEWRGFRVLPRGLPFAATARRIGADAIVTLRDVQDFRPEAFAREVPWLAWTPVDGDKAPPAITERLRFARLALAMSRHGKRTLERAGLRRVRYVPHAVDCSVFQPPEDGSKRALRERLGIPTDRFVVGIVAQCEPRKALAEQVEAFKALHVKHPDAFLYLHVPAFDVHGEAPPVAELLARHRLEPDSAIVTDALEMALGCSDAWMADLYSSLDVLSNVTLGEGFGLPALHSQACGVPVVTGAWTACEELCGAGWLVAKGDARPEPHPLGGDARWYRPRPGAIAARLEEAYAASGDGSIANRARTFALGYDADRVAHEHWAPLLDELAGELASTTEATA